MCRSDLSPFIHNHKTIMSSRTGILRPRRTHASGIRVLIKFTSCKTWPLLLCTNPSKEKPSPKLALSFCLTSCMLATTMHVRTRTRNIAPTTRVLVQHHLFASLCSPYNSGMLNVIDQETKSRLAPCSRNNNTPYVRTKTLSRICTNRWNSVASPIHATISPTLSSA